MTSPNVEATWISWMPSWLPSSALGQFEIAASGARAASWRCARPSAEGWASLGDGLRAAQKKLRAMTVAEIVEAIDKVAKIWTDRTSPIRLEARARVVAATGFSPEAVDRSFDVELKNYRADSLERVLRRELVDPKVLDGFQPDSELKGATRAIGPRVTLVILTGNVPALPALSIVRALLVKSAVIAKVASGEPTFAALFVRSLADVVPAFGEAIAVTYWDRDDETSLKGALSQVEAVIAYGGEAACAAIRAQVGPHQRYIEHGHKLSCELISKEYLEELGPSEVARRIAEDVSTFNQHACIAPQAVIVEGDTETARRFGAEIARAMDAYAKECPLGTLEESDASSLQVRRLTDAWNAASNKSRDLWKASGLDWTVTLAESLAGIAGTGNRMIRVIPASSMSNAIDIVRPIARHLQNVGVGANGSELWTTTEELALLGACRVSEPGRMAEPSMIWKHDGMPCVSQLLRWCDVEMHRESDQ